MDKLTELRNKVQVHLDRLEEIRALEVDKLTDEIRTEMDEILSALDTLEKDIKTEERAIEVSKRFAVTAPPVTEPSTEPVVERAHNREEDKPWNSAGEFFLAVYRASLPGGNVDPRLLRSATGLNESVPSEGGFLVQQDFAQELLKRTYETGVLASRCRRIPIGANANGLKINAVDESSRANGSRWGGIQAYWTNEADEKTKSKPKFRQMELNLHKLTGLCYATDELLQDAAALESVLMDGFSEEFGFKVDDALINGNGAGQPLGILSSNCLVTVAKESGQAASTVVVENIVKMWARMWARSRQNAVWLINQDIEPQLYTMSLSVGTGGVPVYMPANGVSGSPYSTLFGRPVIPIEQCQTLGTKGDIYLADFSQYLIIDKGGMDSATSIHVRFIYDETVYRFVLRIDGQPIWNSALTPYKGSSTLSPFVALATRS